MWAKHAWNLCCDLTWPLALLNLLLWGTRVWGQPGCTHPTYTMQYCLLASGAAQPSASCSSVLTQPNSRGRKLSWMDHWFDLKWQIPCCDFFQKKETVGGGEETKSKQGQRMSVHQNDLLLPHAASTSAYLSCSRCHLHVCISTQKKNMKKCPGVQHGEVPWKKQQGFWNQIIPGLMPESTPHSLG